MLPNLDVVQDVGDQTVPETPEALKVRTCYFIVFHRTSSRCLQDAADSPVITTPSLQTPSLSQDSDIYQYPSPIVSQVSSKSLGP